MYKEENIEQQKFHQQSISIKQNFLFYSFFYYEALRVLELHYFLLFYIYYQLMSLDRGKGLKQGQNNNQDNFAMEISRKDEIKLLKKKMAMLKEAIIQQRRKKTRLTGQLTSIQDKLKRIEQENKKKEEKNEALLAEIRSLKDDLINERNEKQSCLELLEAKLGTLTVKQDTSKGRMDSNRFFGLKALFQK